MTLTKREKQIGAVTIMVFVILALDRFLLTPYIENRDRLFSEEQNLLIEYRKARGILSQWKELSPAFEGALKKDGTDEEMSENEALNFISDMAKENGLALSLLKPAGAGKRGQPEERIFQVVGRGTMKSISAFLRQLESAPFPVLNIKDLQLASRKEGTDDMTLQLRVGELSLPSPSLRGLHVKQPGTLPYEQYKILTERNVFLKDRMPKTVSPVQAVQTILRETLVPAHKSLLTGIVRRGSEYVAFFEDSVSRKTTRVRQGDAFLHGRVDNITLDYVEYTENGKKTTVKIGEDIEISPSSKSGDTKTTVELKPAAVEVIQPSSAAKPGENMLLEQLRRRRQQELE